MRPTHHSGSDTPLYDSIGRSYATTRRPDPRIAEAVRRAIGDARSVVNVGAGAGAYEPDELEVIAVEPSPAMISQRPRSGARVVRAAAECLPLADKSVDVAMTILSDHHWRDRPAGIRELRRVARHRVVLLNSDPSRHGDFWLTQEYLPAFLDLVPERYRTPGLWLEDLSDLLGTNVAAQPVPIPHNCSDGFYQAYWRRPAAYLDASARSNISGFRRLPTAVIDAAIAALERDLHEGAWRRRHHDLLELDELDLGLRLIVAELA